MIAAAPLPASAAPARRAGLADVSLDWPGWDVVRDTLLLQAGFNTTVVIIGATLLGFAAGVIGVFALLRKRALMTDALSHAALPGVVLAFLLASGLGLQGRSLPVLLCGAAVTGVIGVLCIQALLRWTRLREDAAIGIVLSVFFGAGVVGLSYIQKNAATGAAGLNSFIYGQTAAMSVRDALLMASVAGLAVIATALLLKEFTLVCFNDAFARVDGWPVIFVDLLMMALVVIVTVVGLQAVGLILVVALLIIPPVAARFWTDRLTRLVAFSGVIGGVSGYVGASMSALFPRQPAGAVIVLTAGAIFVVSLFIAPARGVAATTLRQARLRLRIAGEHLLEAGYDHGRAHHGDVALSRAEIDAIVAERGWSFWRRALVVLTLQRRGLIRRTSDGVVLTEAGVARGARVSRNHTLWEQYLVSYADIAPSHVDWSVDQVEHVLSDDLIRELESALRRRGVEVPAATGAPA